MCIMCHNISYIEFKNIEIFCLAKKKKIAKRIGFELTTFNEKRDTDVARIYYYYNMEELKSKLVHWKQKFVFNYVLK